MIVGRRNPAKTELVLALFGGLLLLFIVAPLSSLFLRTGFSGLFEAAGDQETSLAEVVVQLTDGDSFLSIDNGSGRLVTESTWPVPLMLVELIGESTRPHMK